MVFKGFIYQIKVASIEKKTMFKWPVHGKDNALNSKIIFKGKNNILLTIN